MINSHLLYQLSYQGIRLATWSGILKMKVGVVKAKNHLFYRQASFCCGLHQFKLRLNYFGAGARAFFIRFA